MKQDLMIQEDVENAADEKHVALPDSWGNTWDQVCYDCRNGEYAIGDTCTEDLRPKCDLIRKIEASFDYKSSSQSCGDTITVAVPSRNPNLCAGTKKWGTVTYIGKPCGESSSENSFLSKSFNKLYHPQNIEWTSAYASGEIREGLSRDRDCRWNWVTHSARAY